jgi:hypothetical protein
MKKRSVEASAMHGRIKLVLLAHWDPIGVRNEPNAQDEYDAYIPPLAQMLASGSDTRAIADYLLAIETQAMGIGGDEDRALRVAERLEAEVV